MYVAHIYGGIDRRRKARPTFAANFRFAFFESTCPSFAPPAIETLDPDSRSPDCGVREGAFAIRHIYSIRTGVAIVSTTRRTLSNCFAIAPLKITPSSIRDRRLETVMLALPKYAR
jgi:hypothetical protein